MLKVLLTVDVEIWCSGWHVLDEDFPRAFVRYVYGPTPRGQYGLPYLLGLLQEYNLNGVFFVEPLFAGRFGIAPLAQVIGLIRERGQEVQLHLHTEWVDEMKEPPLPTTGGKRQHLRHFSRDEQRILIGTGARLLQSAGAEAPCAFRAGSFGFNLDTLSALKAVGIPYDSSYNATLMGPTSGLSPARPVCEPLLHDGVYEYPMTVYYDRPGHLRHAQVGACSSEEMQALLWQALESGRRAFVILTHNFEALNQRKDRPDPIAARRHRDLCRFLDRNRDCFSTCGFRDLGVEVPPVQPQPLRSPLWRTAKRSVEQLYRRRFG